MVSALPASPASRTGGWVTGTPGLERGKRAEVDILQHVAARIVVRTAFPDHPRIRSSTIFLSHGIVETDELTREEVCAE